MDWKGIGETMLVYEGLPGEHISMSAKQAIELARRHNRKVRLKFNGIKVQVNKRLSVKHIEHTYHEMCSASGRRWHRSPAGRAYHAKRAAEIAEKQKTVDALLSVLPASKEQAISWLAQWIPVSDDICVSSQIDTVRNHLLSLGFIENQHVGDETLRNRTADRMKRIEWVAGQVVNMLQKVGCVHPMLGDFAHEITQAA